MIKLTIYSLRTTIVAPINRVYKNVFKFSTGFFCFCPGPIIIWFIGVSLLQEEPSLKQEIQSTSNKIQV